MLSAVQLLMTVLVPVPSQRSQVFPMNDLALLLVVLVAVNCRSMCIQHVSAMLMVVTSSSEHVCMVMHCTKCMLGVSHVVRL